MQVQTYSPAGIFGHHTRYVVPLFQRPHVWTMEDQWQLLWEDVRTVADRLLEVGQVAFGIPPVPPHFLGAIVLDQQMIQTGFIAVRHVVDGQQRLTTLRLLLDAAQWGAEHHGGGMDAQALRVWYSTIQPLRSIPTKCSRSGRRIEIKMPFVRRWATLQTCPLTWQRLASRTWVRSTTWSTESPRCMETRAAWVDAHSRG